MALTLDQLSDLVEALQKKVETLETETKQYRQDILELEQQLSQSITTQKLVVIGEAQIVNRDVKQTFTDFEQRLSSHDVDITTAQSTASTAVSAASTAQGTADSAVRAADDAQSTANSIALRVQTLEDKTQKITSDGQRTVIDSPLTINVAASRSQIIALLINVGSFGTALNLASSFYLLAKDLGGSSKKEIKP